MMARDLIYGSVPRGLLPGTSGYATVTATQGFPKDLRETLERWSGMGYNITNRRHVEKNPIGYSCIKIRNGVGYFYILSEFQVGLDMDRRLVVVTRHVVCDEGDLGELRGGPAAVLQDDKSLPQWDGSQVAWTSPRELPRNRETPAGVCNAWQNACNDAGHAGVLIEATLDQPQRPIYIVVDDDTEPLDLVAEALALMSPQDRWSVTFNTRYAASIPEAFCQWRFIGPANENAKDSRAFVVNATRSAPAAPSQSARGYVDSARTGVAPRVTANSAAASASVPPDVRRADPSLGQGSRRAGSSPSAEGREYDVFDDLDFPNSARAGQPGSGGHSSQGGRSPNGPARSNAKIPVAYGKKKPGTPPPVRSGINMFVWLAPLLLAIIVGALALGWYLGKKGSESQTVAEKTNVTNVIEKAAPEVRKSEKALQKTAPLVAGVTKKGNEGARSKNEAPQTNIPAKTETQPPAPQPPAPQPPAPQPPAPQPSAPNNESKPLSSMRIGLPSPENFGGEGDNASAGQKTVTVTAGWPKEWKDAKKWKDASLEVQWTTNPSSLEYKQEFNPPVFRDKALAFVKKGDSEGLLKLTVSEEGLRCEGKPRDIQSNPDFYRCIFESSLLIKEKGKLLGVVLFAAPETKRETLKVDKTTGEAQGDIKTEPGEWLVLQDQAKQKDWIVTPPKKKDERHWTVRVTQSPDKIAKAKSKAEADAEADAAKPSQASPNARSNRKPQTPKPSKSKPSNVTLTRILTAQTTIDVEGQKVIKDVCIYDLILEVPPPTPPAPPSNASGAAGGSKPNL